MFKILENHNVMQNAVFKRDSGHNTIMVKPSPSEMRFARNWFHFYLVLVGVPAFVLATIISIRENPVLTEIPEGYEPLPWEYEKHAVSRFCSRYLFYPLEREFEAFLGLHEYNAEARILSMLGKKIDSVMKFYNDHRSKNFIPSFGADYVRKGRDEYGRSDEVSALPNTMFEPAFDSDTKLVPVEGYSKV